ncbi:MAG TPA: YccF domain-containing protein [Caulobacteraceae bacterium]|jgi:uncharacterized membrane protein YccF (DUF307 family)
MTLILNVLWFIFGGFVSGLAWLIGTGVMALTIIGLPWVPASFRIAIFAFAPFGRHAVPRALVTGRDDLGTGCFGLVLNIVWFVFAGWYIALAHLVIGVAQAVTLIGIPFAIQHFKLAMLSVAPVGMTIRP